MNKFAYFFFPRFYSCQTKVNPSFFIQFRDDTIQNTFLGYVRFHVKEKVFCPIPHVFHDVFAAPFSQYESVCSQNMPQMVGPFPLRRSFGRSSVDMEDKSNTFFSCIIHMMISLFTYFYHSENMFWFYSRMALEFAMYLSNLDYREYPITHVDRYKSNLLLYKRNISLLPIWIIISFVFKWPSYLS